MAFPRVAAAGAGARLYHPAVGTRGAYGVYDIADNTGSVSIGIDHDTASFGINPIGNWCTQMGRERYPDATRLMIAADGCGSNGSRVRLWKLALQRLADELRMPITVCHLSPGTSKWNRIEHRLFAFITANWRSKPPINHHRRGIEGRSQLDPNTYPAGVKVSDAELHAVNLVRHAFHGDWNHTIQPSAPLPTSYSRTTPNSCDSALVSKRDDCRTWPSETRRLGLAGSISVPDGDIHKLNLTQTAPRTTIG
ncbi:hypothetical protein BAE42_31120 [Mesorhizobium loti]|uniref:ISAzo13 family transposase n=1 Tax=Mesorhizobium erdmanii TaxID=1777866 RepID=A0A6M7UT80_9HYPH|nr:hypothetical protein BAE42_31120 [Mesorhizobium loti]OBQ63749.1 hypothetical protein A8146_31100 [Mesorhizobium loti]QKC79207.1 ISAzo13 family transposase [Mesorhizobium erdmanii]